MLLYTLPDARVIVLIILLVSLRGDLVRRIQVLDIDYLEWVPREYREVALVIVSTEVASTKDFIKYARGLVAQ
jgi:hypothetical protein